MLAVDPSPCGAEKEVEECKGSGLRVHAAPPTITAAELARHNTATDAWMSIDGRVGASANHAQT
jgi:hypothetical protein